MFWVLWEIFEWTVRLAVAMFVGVVRLLIALYWAIEEAVHSSRTRNNPYADRGVSGVLAGAILAVGLAALVGISALVAPSSSERSTSVREVDRSTKRSTSARTTRARPARHSVVVIERRLERAGLDVSGFPNPRSSKANGHVSGVAVDLLASPANARKVGRGIHHVFAEHPGRGRVSVIGSLVFWLGQPRALTGTEIARFRHIVAVALGR